MKRHDLFSINPQTIFEIEEQKFEEDIISKPPNKLFSISTELEYKENPNLKTWNDVLSIFPKLDLELSKDKSLTEVNGLKVKETTYKLGEILFEGLKKAEVGFSVWHSSDNEKAPIIIEFDIDVNVKDLSINGKKEMDAFSDPVIVEIDNLYRNLHNNFRIGPNNITKTEYIYKYKIN